jgi:hypothetical protein
VLVGLTGLVFGRAIRFPLLDWDDRFYLAQNPLVRHPMALGLRTLLSTPWMGYPQPLTVLSQHLDYMVGHGAPWPFHLTNLLLHVANVLLAMHILRGYDLSRLAVVTAGGLLAAHPIVTEPVCWATGRKDLLAALAVLAGFAVYRRIVAKRGPAAWAFALVMLVLAVAGMGCKPIAAVLPALCVADWLVFSRRPAAPAVAAIATTGAVALAGILKAHATQRGVGALATTRTAGDVLRYVIEHTALQLRHYVLPVGLLPKYLDPLPAPLRTPWGLAALAIVIALVGAVLWAALRGQRVILFGLAWFAIGFAPSSGLMALNRGPADTYLYLPGLGLSIVVGVLVDRARPHLHFSAAWLTASLVAVCGFASFVQTDLWRSSSTLWRALRDAYPAHRASWWAYADALAGEGHIQEAISVYEDGLSRFPYPPDDPAVLSALGLGRVMIGDRTGAVRWYGEVVRHFGADLGRAARLVAVCGGADAGPYTAELGQARRALEQTLATLAASPPPGRSTKARELFDRHLAHDRIPIQALRGYIGRPPWDAGARALLAGYGLSE